MNNNIRESLLVLALNQLKEEVRELQNNPQRGLRGPAGRPGRDIISEISINESGNLIIELNDGNTLDVGNIVGPQGPEGPRGRDTILDMFINADDNLVIELNDGSAHVIDGIKGPQGEQGPRGERGFIGEQGEQGIQGIQGLPGERGPKGAKGDTGPGGPAGPKGEAGKDGISPDIGPILEKYRLEHSRFISNVNKSLASLGGGGLGERDVISLVRKYAVTSLDSNANVTLQGLDSDAVLELIQSSGVDSNAVINLIDSDYIQSRQLLTSQVDGIDSDAVIGLIDSDYIQSRVSIQAPSPNSGQRIELDFGSFIQPTPNLLLDLGSI